MNRRTFVATAGAAFAGSMFPDRIEAANDRIRIGFIGTGMMGRGNLGIALKQPSVEVAAVCDVYEPHLAEAAEMAASKGHPARRVKDFREILADPSIDAVCVATPDHWHAYMTVEACKAGKDVYVEKPICTFLEEGQKMVEAARKYNRVVQAGTQQRSGGHFQEAVNLVRSGQLGKLTYCRTWIVGRGEAEGIGNPPDSDPPPDLDWNMWLGPAPLRRFNANRWGVHPEIKPRVFPYFRYFWDYAGGTMTDWGVHLLDIVQWGLGESMPRSVDTMGGKFYVTDNRDTPDTEIVTYEYPGGVVATFETLENSEYGPLGRSYGIMFHGSEGSLFIDRELYRILPESRSKLAAVEVKAAGSSNMAHWANFLDCIRSRQRPAADVAICHRSTATCLLGNIAYRCSTRLDWDDTNQTVLQPQASAYLRRSYRDPWKLEV